jgi:hypothetical protein
MNLAPEARRRLDLIVLLALALWTWSVCDRYYAPYTFIYRDGSFYAQTNRAIAQTFSLRQEAFQPSSWYDGTLPWYRDVDVAWSNVSLGSGGEWYPKHSYLMPVFSTPLFVVFGIDGLLVFNAVVLTLGLWLGYLLAARYVAAIPAALVTLVVAGTPLVEFMTYAYSHDVFYSTLVAASLLCVATGRDRSAGLLAGLALFAKVTNVLVLVPMTLAIAGFAWRRLLRIAALAAVPVAVFLAANAWMYGSPLTTSYNRMLTVVEGKQQVESVGASFDTPILDGLYRYVDPREDEPLVPMAAAGLVAFIGCLPLFRRERRLAIGLTASFAAFTVVFALYNYGASRFFMPLLLLAPLPGAVLFESAAGLAGRAGGYLRALAARGRLRAIPWIAGGAAVAVVAGFWVRAAIGPDGTSMSGDADRLLVTLDNTPCDYYNMGHLKWECSHLDPGGGYFVGRSVGSQCALGQGTMVRVSPNPANRTRVVTWYPQRGARGLTLHFGIEPDSRPGRAVFSVEVAGRRVFEGSVDKRGVAGERTIAMPIEPDVPVRLIVQPSPNRDLGFCFDARLADPR